MRSGSTGTAGAAPMGPAVAVVALAMADF
jgi:hypothetical protein